MRKYLAMVLAVLVLSITPPASATTWQSACQKAIASHSQALCNRVRPVGHRAFGGANENTLLALSKDHQLGVGCETDTWRLAAADGTPRGGPSAIFHDQFLGRVVSAESLAATGLTPETYIGDVTLAQFRQLRTKGGQPLPTLYQWIRHLGKWQVPCMIEIKTKPLDPAQVARWVKTYGAHTTFYQTPEDPTSPSPCGQSGVMAMKAVGMKIGLKYRPDCPMSVAQMAAVGYSYFTYRQPSRSLVTQAHTFGLQVGAGGRTDVWPEEVSARVDFMLANHPGYLRTWLRG